MRNVIYFFSHSHSKEIMLGKRGTGEIYKSVKLAAFEDA
jgi:hypothetical protein